MLLSGGSTFGLCHAGVIKVLHECKLLPRIISGASSGSIVAAMVCTRDESDLTEMLADGNLNLNFFGSKNEGRLFRNFVRVVRGGASFFDIKDLTDSLRDNFGDITFQVFIYIDSRKPTTKPEGY